MKISFCKEKRMVWASTDLTGKSRSSQEIGRDGPQQKMILSEGAIFARQGLD
jgi:hypothetical protein